MTDWRGIDAMAWSLTHAKLQILLRQRGLLTPNSRILMAVSGGQDSLCMAQLLIELRPHWHWSLAMVHCDHRWREDSADNAAHVLQLAQAWQLPAWLEVAEVPSADEAAARKWRYEVFARLARAQAYDYVVTGHTASDRAETVLYHLIRGTGTDGIGTLPWHRSIDAVEPTVTLVRPLLAFSRQETAEFCQAQQLAIWPDPSNQDWRFRRNRIRQQLLPYLREHFNPQVEQSLAHTAEIAAAETAYLAAQTDRIYRQVIYEAADCSIWQIDANLLSAQPLALKRRVMRQLLVRALPQPPTFAQIEKLVDLIEAPNGSQTDTYPGGLVAQVRKPIVWLGPAEQS
jgi:tRNA(Ile)-lysidine synthase